MATNLYGILSLDTDATAEQIRRAYRKKALETHPDRLPPGATPAEKASAEERFLKVNNAYEVLNDPQKRRIYDIHGVWPPPETDQEDILRESRGHHRPHGGHHPHGYHQRMPPRPNAFPDLFGPPPGIFSFAFTDPFVLFDSIFGDHHRHHRSDHYQHHHQGFPLRHESSFDRAFRRHAEIGNLMVNVERDLFSGIDPWSRSSPTSAYSSHEGSQGPWLEERVTTTMVNGVTESVYQRRDWEGNEHVTRKLPDGREIHTVNGIEQPSAPRGFLPGFSPESRHIPPASHLPGPRSDYLSPPPPYPSHSGGYSSSPHDPVYPRRRDRRYSDSPPVIPEPYHGEPSTDYGRHHDRSHRKRMWRGW